MVRLARFIVDHKKSILLLFAVLLVFCVFGMRLVEIEYSITAYLPQDTDTRRAIDIMDEEFITYGSAKVMVRNISYEKALELHDRIEELDGVKSFSFSNTPDYYSQSSALFSVTFEGDEDDPASAAAYEQMIAMLSDYDLLIESSLIDTYAEDLQSDVNFVLVLSVIVIVMVLVFTSKSIADVPIFLATFLVAAILNLGTNFLFGTISFISNSVCSILQLALAIDYAIILSHRFAEEKEQNGGDAYEAVVQALAKAIPEISGSSLTTIAGLLALTTMTLRLGADLGLVLAKSIVCSMISVFLFMPCIIVSASKLIDRLRHRNLVPSVRCIGRFDVKMRFVLPIFFLVLVSVCTVLSFQNEYVYSANSIDTDRPSDSQVAEQEIEQVFGYSNLFVVLVPGKDYEQQKQILDMVEAHEEIDQALGLANTELTLNHETVYLTEPINYKRFASLLVMDDETADAIFSAYAFFSMDDTKSGLEEMAVYEANKNIYTVSLLELCDCAFSHDDFISAYLYDDDDALENYEDLRDTVQDAEDQLLGPNYSRLLFNINGPVESKETFALIGELLTEVKGFCPGAIFAGDSMSSYDLNESFASDNLKVSLLTALFVFVILMCTFRSWGLPIPLTLTIQGAIFINFSYYTITGTNLFFFVYLIVSAIQMGATIDYAIVITNRYAALRREEGRERFPAMIEAINAAFPTVLTSGTILAASGFLIGGVVRDPLIATMGTCLGRGVLISIASVLLVLPALLVIFEKPLEKTYFKERKRLKFPKINRKNREILSENTTQKGENIP
ncbi:MAG: RND family transporter [Eubacteriales bacterium]